MGAQERKRPPTERRDFLPERITGLDDMLSEWQVMGKKQERGDAPLARTSPQPIQPVRHILPCGVPHLLSPKVISSKDIPRNDFKMYDAVLADQGHALPPMDPEMEKFLPMLQDYLTRTRLSSFSFIEKLIVQPVQYKKPFLRVSSPIPTHTLPPVMTTFGTCFTGGLILHLSGTCSPRIMGRCRRNLQKFSYQG